MHRQVDGYHTSRLHFRASVSLRCPVYKWSTQTLGLPQGRADPPSHLPISPSHLTPPPLSSPLPRPDVFTVLPLSPTSRGVLRLLGSPSLVGLPHIRRRLDGGDELEDDVNDAHQGDDGADNGGQGPDVEEDRADEDVDCVPGTSVLDRGQGETMQGTTYKNRDR